MAGYLEDYGVGDAQREKKLKWITISVIVGAVLAVTLYAVFRDFKEDRRVSQFRQALKQQDFKTAYTFWGCTFETPCRDYAFDKFMEDWGPQGANAKVATAPVADSERCGNGYIVAFETGKEPVSLWVERDTGVLSYAPWSVCPERKLRIMKWLKMKFGRG
jgi:hypothetical protein